MSTTPRTDEEVAKRIQPFSEPFVPASFARQLERETAIYRAALNKIAGNDADANRQRADGIAIEAICEVQK